MFDYDNLAHQFEDSNLCSEEGNLLDVSLDFAQAQRERLAFLELRAFFTGELRRSDIEARFGIKPAASSRDLALYREIAPENLEGPVRISVCEAH